VTLPDKNCHRLNNAPTLDWDCCPANMQSIEPGEEVRTDCETRLHNLVLLAYQLNGFISDILVYPDLLAVVALPEITETFKDIIELKSDEPVYLVYDTTFNLS
jgi:hypothetical protein